MKRKKLYGILTGVILGIFGGVALASYLEYKIEVKKWNKI